MIAADRHQDTAVPDDPARRFTHAGEVAVIVSPLDHNVSDIDHRDPAEAIAVALDVVPADSAVLQATRHTRTAPTTPDAPR